MNIICTMKLVLAVTKFHRQDVSSKNGINACFIARFLYMSDVPVPKKVNDLLTYLTLMLLLYSMSPYSFLRCDLNLKTSLKVNQYILCLTRTSSLRFINFLKSYLISTCMATYLVYNKARCFLSLIKMYIYMAWSLLSRKSSHFFIPSNTLVRFSSSAIWARFLTTCWFSRFTN